MSSENDSASTDVTELELRDLYHRMAHGFSQRLQEVGDKGWSSRTRCCPDWTVHDLVNHVVNENRWIPPLLDGESVDQVGSRFDGDLLGDEPKEAWRSAVEGTLQAIARQGALDGTVQLSSGVASARSYIAEVLSDQIVHTWDLATSVEADARLDPELVEFAYRTLEPLAEKWRQAGYLGDPVAVPDGADHQTKLLALLGRRAEAHLDAVERR
jgi:uncharacterized protein (TIGR03086 family)